MYRTILVAFDCQDQEPDSAQARTVREVAAALASQTSKHLYVVGVYDYTDVDLYGLPLDLAGQFKDEQIYRTNTLMGRKIDDYVACLTAQGVEVFTILRAGKARQAILQVATEIKADLLIIGARGKRGLCPFAGIGLAQQVRRGSPCPVLVVSPRSEPRL